MDKQKVAAKAFVERKRKLERQQDITAGAVNRGIARDHMKAIAKLEAFGKEIAILDDLIREAVWGKEDDIPEGWD